LTYGIVSVEKSRVIAHRINDFLSVGKGGLNVGDDRINDRIYDLAPAPINRINDRINGRVTKTYYISDGIYCFGGICY
jgi:hypothetical protein